MFRNTETHVFQYLVQILNMLAAIFFIDVSCPQQNAEITVEYCIHSMKSVGNRPFDIRFAAGLNILYVGMRLMANDDQRLLCAIDGCRNVDACVE